MNKLKELQEQRGVKLKAATAITDLAATEKRNLTSEEISKLDGLHAEISEIDENIRVEVKNQSLRSQAPVEVSHGEARDIARFDYQKFLRGLAHNTMDGVEREMVQEGQRESDLAQLNNKGVMLPRMLVRRGFGPAERRDLTATGGTAGDQGGMTIQTDKVGLADDFYDRLVLRQGGATVLEGLQGNLDLPRYLADSDPAHKAENAAAGELSPTTAMLSLSPKRLPAFIDISDQLMRQSSVAIESIVRSNINSQLLGVLENRLINGGGTSEPDGILQTSGIGSVVGGTNGAAPDWADVINLETEVAVDNADIGALHYLTNVKVRGKFKQTPRIASTDSMMIMDDRAGGMLNGYTPLITNAVPSTLTKGSASGVCSAIIFGNFNDLIMGFWGGVSFELLRDVASAKLSTHVLVVTIYYDGGVIRPQSFAAMQDALTT
jgi:HK97 family phage major capsid protein